MKTMTLVKEEEMLIHFGTKKALEKNATNASLEVLRGRLSKPQKEKRNRYYEKEKNRSLSRLGAGWEAGTAEDVY